MLDLDSMAMLYGRRGSYKSFMALDWALCVANGTRWHSRPTTQGTVVYLVGEGLNGFVQRIDAWRAHHPMQGETNLLLYPEAVNLLSPSSVGPFADECARVGASLVVIDTLSRCFVGGEENGGKDGSIGVEQLDVIRKRTGACVLLVHHAGKDAERGSRGWSGWGPPPTTCGSSNRNSAMSPCGARNARAIPSPEMRSSPPRPPPTASCSPKADLPTGSRVRCSKRCARSWESTPATAYRQVNGNCHRTWQSARSTAIAATS
ncbi:MAG: AAA family ATPase [Acidimicrobiaceae bacterium]|nr:AAA family ATPase [Acidimicrobiaceae bacterium]